MQQRLHREHAKHACPSNPRQSRVEKMRGTATRPMRRPKSTATAARGAIPERGEALAVAGSTRSVGSAEVAALDPMETLAKEDALDRMETLDEVEAFDRMEALDEVAALDPMEVLATEEVLAEEEVLDPMEVLAEEEEALDPMEVLTGEESRDPMGALGPMGALAEEEALEPMEAPDLMEMLAAEEVPAEVFVEAPADDPLAREGEYVLALFEMAYHGPPPQGMREY